MNMDGRIRRKMWVGNRDLSEPYCGHYSYPNNRLLVVCLFSFIKLAGISFVNHLSKLLCQ